MLFSPEGLDPKLIAGVAVYPFPGFVIFISETAPTTATTSSSFPEPTILTIGGSSGSYPLPPLVIDILSISPSSLIVISALAFVPPDEGSSISTDVSPFLYPVPFLLL